METTKKIYNVLDKAESEIRQIGADAFRVGDDTTAASARDVVNALKALRLQLNKHNKEIITSSSKHLATKSQSKKTTSKKSQRRKQASYPKYNIRNGALIRIGWSKKRKTEYLHKAPRKIFDRTVEAMSTLAVTGRSPFMAEKIIEQASDSKGEVPSYQVYMIIGLLRDYGYINQVGREGYIIPSDILTQSLDIWGKLEKGA